MAVDPKVAEQVMQARIDRYADSREQPGEWGDRGLGEGFYSVETRAIAAMMAAQWLAVSDDWGVSLEDLDGCTSIAIAALDAVHASRRTVSR